MIDGLLCIGVFFVVVGWGGSFFLLVLALGHNFSALA